MLFVVVVCGLFVGCCRLAFVVCWWLFDVCGVLVVERCLLLVGRRTCMMLEVFSFFLFIGYRPLLLLPCPSVTCLLLHVCVHVVPCFFCG